MSTNDPQHPRAYETYERPGMVVPYLAGTLPIAKGHLVGVDAAGLLVPILEAEAFVGVANHDSGSPGPDGRTIVNVTVCGSFTFGFVGWAPTLVDLQRSVWAFDGTTVAPIPARSKVRVGMVVGVETTSDGRHGVRVRIDEAVGRGRPWSDEETAGAWEWYLTDCPPSGG